MARVLLACSGGGHLREGLAIINALYDTKKDIIGVFTYHTEGVEKLLPKARWFFTINPGRNPLKYMRVVIDSLRALRSFSPDVVVSAGAGMTLPILALAKILGIRTMFFESAAQVITPSLSARIAYLFVDEFYYPWPQLRKFFQKGKLFETPLLYLGSKGHETKKKNIVLVIVGTHSKPFDRLLRLVDNIASQFPDREFVFQIGHSKYIPRRGTWFRFTDAQTIEKLFQEAKWVVAHAGVGTIMDALAHGVVPFVIPRLKEFGEHTNDHQLQIVKVLSKRGLVITGSETDLIRYLQTEGGTAHEDRDNRT